MKKIKIEYFVKEGSSYPYIYAEGRFLKRIKAACRLLYETFKDEYLEYLSTNNATQKEIDKAQRKQGFSYKFFKWVVLNKEEELREIEHEIGENKKSYTHVTHAYNASDIIELLRENARLKEDNKEAHKEENE